jgi:hypothetical protein
MQDQGSVALWWAALTVRGVVNCVSVLQVVKLPGQQP